MSRLIMLAALLLSVIGGSDSNVRLVSLGSTDKSQRHSVVRFIERGSGRATVTVTIQAENYGAPGVPIAVGRITETLPSGFAYVSEQP